MAIYRLIDRMSGSTNSAVIERIVPRGGIPERFLFEGTRKQARLEVDRLNALAAAKIGATGSRSPRFVHSLSSYDVATWSLRQTVRENYGSRDQVLTIFGILEALDAQRVISDVTPSPPKSGIA
jgi:hypothetical protein